MLYYVIVLLAVMSATVAAVIINSSRKREYLECKRAAAILIKNNMLQDALLQAEMNRDRREKLIVCLEWKNPGKEQYVFDPERRIHIGRDRAYNEVCIQDMEISQRHCVIFLSGGRVCIRDRNSENGTWIRSFFRKKRITHTMTLKDGDTFFVGSFQIKIRLIYIDMSDF